jgi:hypothetical protein
MSVYSGVLMFGMKQGAFYLDLVRGLCRRDDAFVAP